jgi:hypothetical protein
MVITKLSFVLQNALYLKTNFECQNAVYYRMEGVRNNETDYMRGSVMCFQLIFLPSLPNMQTSNIGGCYFPENHICVLLRSLLKWVKSVVQSLHDSWLSEEQDGN